MPKERSMHQLSPSTEEAVNPFLNQLINKAITQRASDIHIEPYQHNCRVRFREDGLLYEIENLSPSFAQRLILTLKMLAQLNIAEKRVPQDGRLMLLQRELRISTCPTLYGEKLVLRLQPTIQDILTLDQLGMTTEQHTDLMNALHLSQGLILITGPTGSGKTMTLYAAINYLNKMNHNIVTIEDPIEISIEGITQVNLNEHLEFTFANVLRNILRQDPDIIMIGEIRDHETAELAIHAANTGHLVLASMHTANAKTAIRRLQSLGIRLNTLAESITLVLSQRLIRRVCDICHAVQPNCHYCRQGYHGRIGIFELLSFKREWHAYLQNNKKLEQ